MYNSALELEEGPFPLSNWKPPVGGAIYGIIVKQKNGEYRLIHIGQSESLSVRGFGKGEHARWLAEAGDLSNLYIAYHYMPSSAEEQRIAIMHDLIRLRELAHDREAAFASPSSTTRTVRTRTAIRSNVPNMFEALKSVHEIRTLIQTVEMAGLTDTLRSSGQYTLFAPTEVAFSNLPVGTVDGWIKDLPKLRSILNYHIVNRKLTASEIHEMTMDGRTPSVKTLQGSSIRLKSNLTLRSWVNSLHSVYANDAMIVRPEIVTGNGIIQVVDRVLRPAF
jgi:uncharacterized surface protein with fasciclin (FAS1) repeats